MQFFRLMVATVNDPIVAASNWYLLKLYAAPGATSIVTTPIVGGPPL
jgi:hypothetical protein